MKLDFEQAALQWPEIYIVMIFYLFDEYKSQV